MGMRMSKSDYIENVINNIEFWRDAGNFALADCYVSRSKMYMMCLVLCDTEPVQGAYDGSESLLLCLMSNLYENSEFMPYDRVIWTLRYAQSVVRRKEVEERVRNPGNDSCVII